MLKKKNGKLMKPRIGVETSLFLRTHGGVHTTKKGILGYNRKNEKVKFRKELEG
jgi:hypothetical protein